MLSYVDIIGLLYPGDVVFNTNEQKTATIGRVPRVNRMSSFYGDLNTSNGTLERYLSTFV